MEREELLSSSLACPSVVASSRRLGLPVLYAIGVASTAALYTGGSTFASPAPGETVVISEPESAPVHGAPGVRDVSVIVEESGGFDTEVPAILGLGPDWSIFNQGNIRLGIYEISGEDLDQALATVSLGEGGLIDSEADSRLSIFIGREEIEYSGEAKSTSVAAGFLGRYVELHEDEESGFLEVRTASGAVYNDGWATSRVIVDTMDFLTDDHELVIAGFALEAGGEVFNFDSGRIAADISGETLNFVSSGNEVGVAGVYIGEGTHVIQVETEQDGTPVSDETYITLSSGEVINSNEIGGTLWAEEVSIAGDENEIAVAGVGTQSAVNLENSGSIDGRISADFDLVGDENVLTASGVLMGEGSEIIIEEDWLESAERMSVEIFSGTLVNDGDIQGVITNGIHVQGEGNEIASSGVRAGARAVIENREGAYIYALLQNETIHLNGDSNEVTATGVFLEEGFNMTAEEWSSDDGETFDIGWARRSSGTVGNFGDIGAVQFSLETRVQGDGNSIGASALYMEAGGTVENLGEVTATSLGEVEIFGSENFLGAIGLFMGEQEEIHHQETVEADGREEVESETTLSSGVLLNSGVISGVRAGSVHVAGDSNIVEATGAYLDAGGSVQNGGSIVAVMGGSTIEITGNENRVSTAGLFLDEGSFELHEETFDPNSGSEMESTFSMSFSGDVTNTGDIQATYAIQDTFISGTANAVEVLGVEMEEWGSIQNSGTIGASLEGYVEVDGHSNFVGVAGTVALAGGDLVNSGEISARYEGDYYDEGIANRLGVAATAMTGGSVTNESLGRIQSDLKGDVYLAGQHGNVMVGGLVMEDEGFLVNHGSINAALEGDVFFEGDDNEVKVAGSYLEGLTGGLDNTGEIFGNIFGDLMFTSSGNDVELVGLLVESDATISNPGDIGVYFDGAFRDFGSDNSLEMAGIAIEGDAQIVNEGNIAALFTGRGQLSGSTEIDMAALYIDGDFELLNEGYIAAGVVVPGLVAEEGAETSAAAVYAEGSAEIENRGHILISQLGLPDGAETNIVGILVEGESGLLRNEGLISVAGSSDEMAGVVFSHGGRIENSGAIVIENTADESVTAGLYFGAGEGTSELINDGELITVGGNAVTMMDGGNLTNRGRIEGNIYLGAGDATMSIAPGSITRGEVDAGAGSNTLRLIAAAAEETGSGSYDGSFNGFAALQIDATDTTWHLENDQNYAAGTKIFDGILVVADKLTSRVDIYQAGTLVGRGSIVGDLDVSGTLRPEGLQVEGDVTLREGSTYHIIPGEGVLEATGIATIEGGNAVASTQGGLTPRVGHQILHAEQGVVGEFDQVSFDGFDLMPLLTPEVRYVEQGIELFLDVNEESIRDLGTTRSQRSMAEALATLQPQTEALDAAYNEFLLQVNEENFGSVADSLSGEIFGSAAFTSSISGHAFRQAVMNSLGGKLTARQAPIVSQSWQNMAGTQFAGTVTPAEERTRTLNANFWARGYGAQGDLKPGNEAADLDYRTGGLLLGADTLITEATRGGVAFGYGESRTNRVGAADRVEADVYQVALYGTHRLNDFAFDGIVGYAYHDFESRRLTQPGNNLVEGDYRGNEFSAVIETSYLYAGDRGLFVQPLVGLDYTHFRSQSFEEQGSFGLAVDAISVDSLRATIGTRAAWMPESPTGGAIIPEFRARYSRELMDRDAAFSASFVGDPGSRFLTESARLPRDRWNVGGGVTLQPAGAEHVSLFGDYDATLTSAQTEHLFSAGVRVSF